MKIEKLNNMLVAKIKLLIADKKFKLVWHDDYFAVCDAEQGSKIISLSKDKDEYTLRYYSPEDWKNNVVTFYYIEDVKSVAAQESLLGQIMQAFIERHNQEKQEAHDSKVAAAEAKKKAKKAEQTNEQLAAAKYIESLLSTR